MSLTGGYKLLDFSKLEEPGINPGLYKSIENANGKMIVISGLEDLDGTVLDDTATSFKKIGEDAYMGALTMHSTAKKGEMQITFLKVAPNDHYTITKEAVGGGGGGEEGAKHFTFALATKATTQQGSSEYVNIPDPQLTDYRNFINANPGKQVMYVVSFKFYGSGCTVTTISPLVEHYISIPVRNGKQDGLWSVSSINVADPNKFVQIYAVKGSIPSGVPFQVTVIVI